MAAPPRWDPDQQEWVYPEDPGYTPPGRDPAPNAPPGYTIPEPTQDPGPAPIGTPAPAPTPNPNPAPNPNPPPNQPPPIGPFGGSFNAPDRQAYPSLPQVPNAPIPNLPQIVKPPPFAYDPYQAASPFSYQDFKGPNADEALQDPSYVWRKQQGEDSLQRWAAAKGTLNDSGTAKALIDYGGNAASQEYSNIWNRDWNTYTTNRTGAFDAFNVNEANRAGAYNTNRAGAVQQYNTNYQTQFDDPYQNAYQAAIDTWIPAQETWRAGVDMSRLGYTTQTGLVQHDNDTSYNNAWNRFLTDWEMWKDKRDTGINLAGD